MGRRRTGQDPPIMATLLHWYPGSCLRRRFLRPRAHRRGSTGTSQNPCRQGNEGLLITRVRQQARLARRCVSNTPLHPIASPHPQLTYLVFVLTAMSPAEVTEKLGLHRMRDRLWYVHPRFVHDSSILFYHLTPHKCSCATTGEGLFEGLQWLSNTVRRQQK